MHSPISISASTTGRSKLAQAIANATYKDAAGADQPSPNKWQAVYILGQIYDARRQPAKALEYYKQVADRFSDAAGAIQAYTRKDLKVPEVSIVRPAARASRRGPARRRKPASADFGSIDVVGATARPSQPPAKPGISLDFRNIAQVDVKVYPGRFDAALPHAAQLERDLRNRPGRHHSAG